MFFIFFFIIAMYLLIGIPLIAFIFRFLIWRIATLLRWIFFLFWITLVIFLIPSTSSPLILIFWFLKWSLKIIFSSLMEIRRLILLKIHLSIVVSGWITFVDMRIILMKLRWFLIVNIISLLHIIEACMLNRRRSISWRVI